MNPNRATYAHRNRYLLNTPTLPPTIPIRESRLRLETYITSSIPQAFNTLLATFKACIKALYRLNAHRQYRFLTLCPMENSYRFAKHIHAVRTLLCWREEYRPLDPMLCPSMKVPRFAMERLCVSRAAYDAWAGTYNEHLARLKMVQFKAYIEAKGGLVQTVERAYRADSQLVRVSRYMISLG